MTAPLPEERHRGRVKLARKWAYLVSEDNYVPHSHVEVEQAMLELVDSLFAALATDPADAGAAAEVGARVVELNCVGAASLVSMLEMLTTAMLRDQETRLLDRLPERVGRVLGGLVSGLVESVRRTTLDQQDGLSRTLRTIARKAMVESESRVAEVGELSTELALLRAQLGHQLLHDALTGLPNRQFFATRLEEALGSGRTVTLFRLELDGYALVNDGLGRLAGEAWLNASAERFHHAVEGGGNLVARLDGGNFAILRESALSTTDIAAMVERINESLAEPSYLDGVGLATTVSVGVVRSPPHHADAGALLHAADLALRAARHAGPGRWALHVPETDTAERRLLRLAAGVPGGWETGQLGIGYELRVGLGDGRPVAVHAFPLWRDEEPNEPGHPSLELAEQAGMTAQLGAWLLRDAGARLRESGAGLVLAVSLSPNQSAAPDLAETVQCVLDGSGLCPEQLRIAMPAAEVCHGRARAAENLNLVRATGVHTAVHDFDGAAADLIQLADLPVREVWLSGRLVRQARRAGPESLVADTVTGLVGLLHRTGATVGVGDVRDHAEAGRWRRAGADLAAGRLYCPAGACTDIADLFG